MDDIIITLPGPSPQELRRAAEICESLAPHLDDLAEQRPGLAKKLAGDLGRLGREAYHAEADRGQAPAPAIPRDLREPALEVMEVACRLDPSSPVQSVVRDLAGAALKVAESLKPGGPPGGLAGVGVLDCARRISLRLHEALERGASPTRQLLSPVVEPELREGGHSHAPDFTWVRLGESEYHFTPLQRAVIKELYEARQGAGGRDGFGLALETLRERSGSVQERFRMQDVFRDHRAYQTILRPGRIKDTWALYFDS